MTMRTTLKRSYYQDSVALMGLARELRTGAGVREAAALMGTPANQTLMADAGLLTEEARAAGPNDLVIVVRADSAAEADTALARAELLLTARRTRVEAAGRRRPRTLDSAVRQLGGANLALISVPGAFAAAEARKALRRGLHVMLFSDNVTLGDEIALKRLAAERGLLLMGPDCGTAYLGGVPLGFANAVPRGRVGLVAASGTGLQQVVTLLAAAGEGVSQAVGVGGRDMSEPVGASMTLAALDALGADPATELIVVVGKPPARAVRAKVEERLHALGKPAVAAMLGREVAPGTSGALTTVATLEDAAAAAVAGRRGREWAPRAFSDPAAARHRVKAFRAARGPAGVAVRGLYAGGTLAYEALLILEPLLGAGSVGGNLGGHGGGSHRVLDLGADEFTVGRAHPMLDAALRIEEIASAAKEPDTAVLLVDVVLGHGAAPDPAGDIAPALEAARRHAQAHGRGLAVVASVVGTAADPQGLAAQTARLEAAGAWVLPSNAQAARAAACIAGEPRVAEALLSGDA
ncbi:MAG TPA: acyl-CoA synthetase FdrA [Methylomirabilota bacterium]|nr:acyl-CoA synthetase FdrA [Methylomirabilota bacterium]